MIDAFKRWVQFVCVDLQEIFRKFQREAPPRETFTLTEVARMAQEQSPTVNAWVRSGVLTPSVRNRDGTQGRAMLFDRMDALRCTRFCGQSDCLFPDRIKGRGKRPASPSQHRASRCSASPL